MHYLTHSWVDKGVHTFHKGVCPKVNVIARMEFELTYYGSVVNRFNHYTPEWSWKKTESEEKRNGIMWYRKEMYSKLL